VSAAVAAAGVAGACGVVAAWEAVAVVEQAVVAAAVMRLVAPLRVAGRRGLEPAVAERRRLALVSAATLLAGGWLLAGPVIGAIVAAAGPFAVARAIAWRRARWRAELEAGAPVVARSLADALGGGHSIRGALAEVARAGGATPAADAELRACAAALEVGEATDAVLERLRARAGRGAWESIVAAVLLQRDAGGDLAGLLRALAAELEAARRAEADARALTAQARFTALVVGALPAGALVLVELGAPGTIAGICANPLSAMLAAVALIVEGVAVVCIRRLTEL
jgi:tight adherence protein B